jgi:hypothetical protein
VDTDEYEAYLTKVAERKRKLVAVGSFLFSLGLFVLWLVTQVWADYVYVNALVSAGQ